MPRLLFMPLIPLIVDRPLRIVESPSIPRTALLPLARQVQQGLGSAAATIAARIARHYDDDPLDVLIEVGAGLWPSAAKILAITRTPTEWVAGTGWEAVDHSVLANAVAALLANAVPLMRIVSRATSGIKPEADELRALLESVAQAGSLPLAMMITMAMKLLPSSELLVGVADAFVGRQNDPMIRATTDRAVEFVLDGIERSPMPHTDVAHAAQDVRQVAIMLADLKHSAQRPARQARVEQVRRSVDAACRERYSTELKERLLATSADLATIGDDAIITLEAIARDLRHFYEAARQIGSADQYDRQLQGTVQLLRPLVRRRRAGANQPQPTYRDSSGVRRCTGLTSQQNRDGVVRVVSDVESPRPHRAVLLRCPDRPLGAFRAFLADTPSLGNSREVRRLNDQIARRPTVVSVSASSLTISQPSETA